VSLAANTTVARGGLVNFTVMSNDAMFNGAVIAPLDVTVLGAFIVSSSSLRVMHLGTAASGSESLTVQLSRVPEKAVTITAIAPEGALKKSV
jgi:hypothetical protein